MYLPSKTSDLFLSGSFHGAGGDGMRFGVLGGVESGVYQAMNTTAMMHLSRSFLVRETTSPM